MTDWLNVLHDAANSIYAAVAEARTRGVVLENREYKHLLDEAAQGALIQTLQRRGVSVDLISEEGNTTINGGGPTIHLETSNSDIVISKRN